MNKQWFSNLIKNMQSKEWVVSVLVALFALVGVVTGRQADNATIETISMALVVLAGAIAAVTDKSNPGFGSHPENRK